MGSKINAMISAYKVTKRTVEAAKKASKGTCAWNGCRGEQLWLVGGIKVCGSCKRDLWEGAA